MTLNILINILEAFIGFSAGIVVGGGFVAFITVLKIIPRLIQLTSTENLIKVYAGSIIMGLLAGTFLTFTNLNWNYPVFILVLWGLAQGIFNGILAAALAEVLHVFPVLFKRIGMEQFLLWLITAMMLGKVFGSLFQWLYFVVVTIP